MKFKKNLFLILFIFLSIFNINSTCDEYKKLNVNGNMTVKKEDLPEEFTNKALETVDEFIRKTFYLNFECLIYFDYITGEIIKCAMGKENKVSITFDNNEFDGYNVASIHNHPPNLLSPPSGKNFGIFKRKFEDYELISNIDCLWILKLRDYMSILLEN